MALMSLLCSTVVSKVNMKDEAHATKTSLLKVCSELAPLEPEFILKVLWCERVDGNGKLGARECADGMRGGW